jgi:transcriptional regulator with XRE-family HTH domain
MADILMAGLAPQLRQRRVDRGWTLESLAAATDLSVPYLSRLESGQRQPSLAALLTLAGTYGLTVSELLGERELTAPGVVRAADAPVHDLDGLRLRTLTAPGAAPGLTALRVTVAADRPAGAPRAHAGYEWVHVLSGRLRLQLGSDRLDLEAGDAATFDARTPHQLAPGGPEDVELLLVVHEPAAPRALPCLTADAGGR